MPAALLCCTLWRSCAASPPTTSAPPGLTPGVSCAAAGPEGAGGGAAYPLAVVTQGAAAIAKPASLPAVPRPAALLSWMHVQRWFAKRARKKASAGDSENGGHQGCTAGRGGMKHRTEAEGQGADRGADARGVSEGSIQVQAPAGGAIQVGGCGGRLGQVAQLLRAVTPTCRRDANSGRQRWLSKDKLLTAPCQPGRSPPARCRCCSRRLHVPGVVGGGGSAAGPDKRCLAEAPCSRSPAAAGRLRKSS